MKLRTATYVNDVTRKEIEEYREKAGCGLNEAKKVLKDKATQLEYFDPESGRWFPVPEVTIVRERQPKEFINPDCAAGKHHWVGVPLGLECMNCSEFRFDN